MAHKPYDPQDPTSVGLVKRKYFTFDSMTLESGDVFGPVTVAYETYGRLNEDKSNAILICHALTGDAHAAGYHTPSDQDPGWWDDMIGPGKGFDTNKYFVFCANILGGCQGTSGPSSVNPETGKPYGMSFPIVTLRDIAAAQKRLVEYLGIEQLFAVAGGSFGGMTLLQFAADYPDMMKLNILLAATASVDPREIAFDCVARNAIMNDPNWNNGDYYDKPNQPVRGLKTARMIGLIQYFSEDYMRDRYGRAFQKKEKPDFNWDIEFSIEGTLEYNAGQKFFDRFDPNSYLYITKAMDYFDLNNHYGSMRKAFERTESKFLVISFSSDWLFPPATMKKIVSALCRAGRDVSYTEVETDKGHDAFLGESEILTGLISNFMERAI